MDGTVTCPSLRDQIASQQVKEGLVSVIPVLVLGLLFLFGFGERLFKQVFKDKLHVDSRYPRYPFIGLEHENRT